MDIRNVQKTGDMHYVYLPTSWCRQNNIGSKSKVSIDNDNFGNLIISPTIKEKKAAHLSLNIAEDDESIIHKLIVACYINPTTSFKIHLEKEMDYTKLLNQKKLISLELVEISKNLITCENTIAITDPVSLLKTMIKKIKNMLVIAETRYNRELIERYEEEIDKSKMLIDKAVIGSLTFRGAQKIKTIDLYYISLISKDLERLVDHIINLNKNEKKFFKGVQEPIDELEKMIEQPSYLDYKTALKFIKKVKRFMEKWQTKDFEKMRVIHLLFNISEVAIDWAVTKEVES